MNNLYDTSNLKILPMISTFIFTFHYNEKLNYIKIKFKAKLVKPIIITVLFDLLLVMYFL